MVPYKSIRIKSKWRMASDRYSSSNGLTSEGFNVWHIRTAYDFLNGVSVAAGVQNIFDTNYTISEGFPEAGRNFFVSLQYTFVKK